MKTIVLAESRRGEKTVLIEKLKGEWSPEYLVTVARRFSDLPAAQEAFLAETPPTLEATLIAQIEANKNLKFKR